MNQKFIILLLGTVFYYGVTYSSPVTEHIPETAIAEIKPPTNVQTTTEHPLKKIETTVKTPSLSEQVNASKVLNASTATVKDANNQTAPSNSTLIPHIDTAKNASETVDSKNETVPSSKVIPQSPTGTPPGTTTVTPVTSMPLVPATNNTNATDTASTTTTAKTPSTSETPSTNNTLPTTVSPKPNDTTVAPTSTSKDNVVEHITPSPVQERHFDGQSFIGGMALTMGLTAIGFIAFKYYKSGKIDMNYRTL